MVSKLVNCNKCNLDCAPVYSTSLSPNIAKYICRSCALKTMEKDNDRRPNEIEETD